MTIKKNLLICIYIAVGLMFMLSSCSNIENSNSTPPKNIHQPQQPTKNASNQSKQPTKVNIFVENSGSMLGYVRQGNEFDRAISNLLTELELQDIVTAANIHKFYINSKPFEQKNVSTAQFIKGLSIRNATTFKGSTGTTSICALLDTVFRRTSKNTLSIFVSDCIISPGKNDASKFVGAEKDAIKLLAKRQCENGKAVVVYRLVSSFNGKFYDCQDNVKQINSDRPFFIWVVGDKSLVANYLKKIPDSKLTEGGLKNRYVFFKAPTQTPKYVIQSTNEGVVVDASHIKKAKLNKDSKSLRIRVAVDMSSVSMLDKYLLDAKNYTVSNKLYKVEKIEKKAGNGTTHVFTIVTTTQVTPATLSISLKNQLPGWVKQSSIPNNRCSDVFSQLNKTYAFEDIMSGMFQGYNSGSNNLLSIKININQ